MCRLFALSGGTEPLSAEFWLLDAPDSLSTQSHRNPDGTGLGTFTAAGRPVVHKAPISAFSDLAFAREARRERSRTFLAHIRFATTGSQTLANTHPFEQDGRLLAHNGVLGGLPQLDDELGDDLSLVKGQTDSERLFALITRETRRRNGDIKAGIATATRWVAEHLPVYSLNLIITTESELFALRYPETHSLYILERAAGGHHGDQPLHHRSSLGTRVRSDEARQRPVIVLASEQMDNDPGWRPLAPGELIHVDAELAISSTIVLPDPPAHPLEPSDLDDDQLTSQSMGSTAERQPPPALTS
jgi:predicted glutamine amidotransferase